MGAILALLGTKMGSWLVIALGASAALLAGLLWVQTIRLDHASLRTAAARLEAAGARQALRTIEADLVLQKQIAADQALALTKLSGVTHEIRTEIIRAPGGTACVSSPPVRALLDGLRRSHGSTDANPPAAGPGPDRAVPASTAPAR